MRQSHIYLRLWKFDYCRAFSGSAPLLLLYCPLVFLRENGPFIYFYCLFIYLFVYWSIVDLQNLDSGPDFWRGINYLGSWPSGNIKGLRKVISFPHSCDFSVNRAHSEPLNVHVACPSHNAGWSDDEGLIVNTKRDYFCGCPGPRMLNGQIGAISRLLWRQERNTGLGHLLSLI